MIRIGICDDKYDERFGLKSALERLLDRDETAAEFFEFSSGEGLLKWMNSHLGELDIIFLDIEMRGINGMEAARRLRELDSELQIVFVTGYADYVYDGYSVGALGYIMKPVKVEKLGEIMTRAMAAIRRDERKSFVCKSGETVYRIPKKDIVYFSSDRRKLCCVTGRREYVFYGKLSEVMEQLLSEGETGFIRIHQRFVINAAYVEQVEKGAVIVRGEELPISRGYQSEAMVKLTRAMLG